MFLQDPYLIYPLIDNSWQVVFILQKFWYEVTFESIPDEFLFGDISVSVEVDGSANIFDTRGKHLIVLWDAGHPEPDDDSNDLYPEPDHLYGNNDNDNDDKNNDNWIAKG